MTNFKNIKVLFWDLDNTIFDTDNCSKVSMKEAYEQLNLQETFPSFEEMFAIYLKCNNQLWTMYRNKEISRSELNERRFVWPLSLIGKHDVSFAALLSDTFYHFFLQKSALVPYAYEVLNSLKTKYRLSIISNGTKSSQIVKMNNCHLNDFFEQVVLSDDVDYRKPDRGIFIAAMKRMNVSAPSALMIGDDFNTDVLGAKNSGMQAIWYNIRKEKIPHNPIQADLTIDSLKTLLDVL